MAKILNISKEKYSDWYPVSESTKNEIFALVCGQENICIPLVYMYRYPFANRPVSAVLSELLLCLIIL